MDENPPAPVVGDISRMNYYLEKNTPLSEEKLRRLNQLRKKDLVLSLR